MPLIPYGWLPRHWGAKGKQREIEKANYELTGEELDRRLAEINFADKELDLRLLEIDRKYQHITKREYDDERARIEFGEDEMGLSLALVEVKKAHGEISEQEYEKSIASINGEEWVGVIACEYNPSLGKDGFSFELDWNAKFVEMLRANGYNGRNDDQIVEQWFEDVSTTEHMRVLNEMVMENELVDHSIPSTTIQHVRTDDGKKIYS